MKLERLKRVLFNQVNEDGAPVNSVGGGAIAGVSPGEQPPVQKGVTTSNSMFRRKKSK